MLDLKLTPVPSQDFCVRQVGEETVFLAESGSQILSLNDVGSFIWKQMDGNHTLRDVLDLLCHEYDVDEATATNDLETFVAQLLEHDLVTMTKGDA